MGWFLPALIGGAASIIGGVLNKKSAEKQQQQQFTYNEKHRKGDRKWFIQDRINERKYAERSTNADRDYAENMRDNERDYMQSVLLDERVYNRESLLEQRHADRRRTIGDRKYAASQLSDQRQYDGQMYNRDITRFDQDRDKMQRRSNNLAERSAASRGIDFVKLRDDAVAAGYNPMTALSMAHAYSTNVDYSVQGGVYSPGANYTTGNAAYSPMSNGSGGSVGGGGASGAAPGAVMGSHVPAGGSFQAGGAGYQSQFNPALSAGSFVQEAMDRSIDSWANQPVAKDPLADALRNAFAQDQMADQVRDAQIPQGFGYNLTEQKPFQPAATVGVPALASGKSAPTRMPSGTLEVGGRKYVPVTKPDGRQGRLEASVARRLDIKPFDTVSPGDWAEIVGEVGEVENIASQPGIRRNITDDWHIGTSVGDYLKSGVTGSRQFPKGQHFNPWMQ